MIIRIEKNDWFLRLRCFGKIAIKIRLWCKIKVSVTCKNIQLYNYIYIRERERERERWPTVVEGDAKAPFSIATTSRHWGRRYLFPWIDPLTLNPYFIMMGVNQGGIKHHFFYLSYDSARDWTQVSWTIGEHFNQYANKPVIL